MSIWAKCAGSIGAAGARFSTVRAPAARARAISARVSAVGTFHLADEDRAGTEDRIGNTVRFGCAIGARRDRDQVFPRIAHHDRRAAGRPIDPPHQTEIDAVALQILQRERGEAIIADRPRHRHRRPRAARRQSLVGALAAGQQRIVAAEHGLARKRQTRHRHQHIDVDRAENQDHRSALL
jgi:hypothetical protein